MRRFSSRGAQSGVGTTRSNKNLPSRIHQGLGGGGEGWEYSTVLQGTRYRAVSQHEECARRFVHSFQKTTPLEHGDVEVRSTEHSTLAETKSGPRGMSLGELSPDGVSRASVHCAEMLAAASGSSQRRRFSVKTDAADV